MKTPSLIAVALVVSLSGGARAQQQNNNRQQQVDPNAPRGTIAGSIVEQGRGNPVKRVNVTLNWVQNSNNQQQQQALPTVAAGAVGTTANLGSTLGPTAGTTAAAAGLPTQNRPNNNQNPNTNNQNNQNQNQQGRGQGGGQNQTVQSGNDGTFIFNDVPAGEYMITVSLDGYLTQEHGQRTLSGRGTSITLQAGQRLDGIDFQMIKAGVISGIVVDEDGNPLVNVQVQALTFNYQRGQRVLQPIGQARPTNDLGEYRLYYLAPGDYYVTARANNNSFRGRGFDIRGVFQTLTQEQQRQFEQQIQDLRGRGDNNNGNPQGGRGRGGQQQEFQAAITSFVQTLPPGSARTALEAQLAAADPVEAYAPAYYPGTADPLQAAAVQLPPSGDVRGIDFNVRPVSTVSLSGVILQPTVVISPRQQTTNNNNNQNRNNNNNNNNNNANNNQNRGGTNNNNNANNNQNRGGTNNNNNANNNQNRGGTNNNNNANNNQNRGGTNNNNANNNQNRGGNNQTANNQQRGTNPQLPNTNLNAQVQLIPIVGASSNNRGGGGGRGGERGGGGGGFTNNPITGRNQVNPDGTFQLTGVIPGTYNLVAVGQASAGLNPTTGQDERVQVTATQKVDVGYGGNIAGLTLQMRPGIRIQGQIYPDGTPPTTFDDQRKQSLPIQLELVDELPNVNQGQAVRATINPVDLTFVADNIIPGARYRVRMQNVNGMYLQAGLYGGENALTAPIVIENEGTSLQLQLGFAPGKIEGTVVDRDKPQRGILTVLVPKDRGRIDLYRTANSGADGKVSFSNVAPGDYKVFAWEEVKEGAWQDVLYMEKFEDKGRLVHIEKAGALTETIDVIKSGAE
jgi:hypothetical protein